MQGSAKAYPQSSFFEQCTPCVKSTSLLRLTWHQLSLLYTDSFIGKLSLLHFKLDPGYFPWLYELKKLLILACN